MCRVSNCGERESRRQAYLRDILSAFYDAGGCRPERAEAHFAGTIPLPFIPVIHILELLALAVYRAPTTRTGFLRNVIVDAENESEEVLDRALQRLLRTNRVQTRR